MSEEKALSKLAVTETENIGENVTIMEFAVVPGGASRGGHAHKQLEQLIIAASGSFDVIADDGTTRKKFSLNRSHYGLYVPSMVWRAVENFSSGSVCLALASEHYDEGDYYRDYDLFLEAAKAQQ